MTISSSLNAGVAGLNVNATQLATIADNIANSGTFGYKRASADFHSMVTEQTPGTYSAGGVRATTTRFIDQRGTLVSTNNPTDLAISGSGFLPVTTAAAVNSGSGEFPVDLMTTGSFRPDADGILRTRTGEVLMGWPANLDGTIPNFPRDSFSALEPVRLNANTFVSDPTTTMELSVNLPATATDASGDGSPYTMTAEYFDNLGISQSFDISFTPTVPGVGMSNEWTLEIQDTASGGAVIGEYVLTFDTAPGNAGNLASVVVVSGGPFDAGTGTLALNAGGGPINMVIGAPGSPGGMTQLSDSFALSPVVSDGSPVSELTQVEVDANGNLHAIYGSGITRIIYQIPVVDVPNVNGLISGSNQTYTVSPDSGQFFLWDAGDGPTGEVIGFAREESTTDVAAELTQLIETQRAYSSNAKVIQTVDEMLQETTNIKR
jgi:flagellar hook protein FlgE